MNQHEINDALPDPPPGMFWNLRENINKHVVLSLRRKGFLGFTVTVVESLVLNDFYSGAVITELDKRKIQTTAKKCLSVLEGRSETAKGRRDLMGNYKDKV